ncbi:hypothetical protein GCM10011374_38850 [Kocuria dechangensis]|uniref:Isoprenylcysteine carboxylmethyltransferase family protein n=2 Tax=Kocuria dechangensis TaxID=1176249 RepID=A0A917H821_9MICC|nr:hypothetical protein GCM10011374_38850 [Kocuria dechangensis]
MIGTALFAVAPLTAGVGIPWALTRWRSRSPVPGGLPARVAGGALMVAGAAAVADSFRRFAVEGLGTPAPVAPTRHLVVTGMYRHVRNPMYVAILAMVTGQGLVLGRRTLFVYAAVLAVPVVVFVKLYEEPTLARTYGGQYQAYRRTVPGWWPRLTPARSGP